MRRLRPSFVPSAAIPAHLSASCRTGTYALGGRPRYVGSFSPPRHCSRAAPFPARCSRLRRAERAADDFPRRRVTHARGEFARRSMHGSCEQTNGRRACAGACDFHARHAELRATKLLQICVSRLVGTVTKLSSPRRAREKPTAACALAVRRQSDEFGRRAERWLRGHSEALAGHSPHRRTAAKVPRRAWRRSFKTLFRARLCRLQRRWVPRREWESLTYLRAA